MTKPKSLIPGRSRGKGERMAKTATATATRGGIDLDPIDRLEEKVKLLVTMIERMKADHARAAEDNQRLARGLDGLRARIASSDGVANELSAVTGARNGIRARVPAMPCALPAPRL